ncbi:septal ring lytic transglycosylase RlpA [Shewanella sp. OPT22]|nr:septal ring lytic transglycosylase RlpA [Shewanella sp. OPT22]
MKTNNLLPLVVSISILALSACSSSGGRYHLKNDRAPVNPPDLSKIENAQPRYEPYSRQGNKPYEVFNKQYRVLQTAKDYVEEGKASYYGAKFHGYHTSNGEVYDMYSMSAAHKTLPIPSYAKVTNLANGKSVIVRVNDRGPFHSNRIIDLSYAAAYKLGMLKHGVADVRVEAIHFDSPTQSYKGKTNKPKTTPIASGHFIQIVASKDRIKLSVIANQLEQKYKVSSRLKHADGLYKLQMGPISQTLLANELLESVRRNGYPQSYLVKTD